MVKWKGPITQPTRSKLEISMKLEEKKEIRKVDFLKLRKYANTVLTVFPTLTLFPKKKKRHKIFFTIG